MPHTEVDTVPSPNSTISTTSTTLPTPDQPYVARRASLPSPRIYDPDMSDVSGDDGGDGGDLFSPMHPSERDRQGSVTPQPKSQALASVTRPDSFALHGVSPTPFSSRPSAGRAMAPPPIMLRRPTGLGNGDVAGEVLTAPGSAKGLNIAGMSLPAVTRDDAIGFEDVALSRDEDHDALPELLSSPRPRLNFGSADGAPASPAWQSFDAPASGGLTPSSWGRRTSQDVPSPIGPQPHGRNFDPTPQHGLHARNLSLYFPQPGAPAQTHPDGTPALLASPVASGETLIPSMAGNRNVFGGTSNFSFGQPLPPADEAGQGGLQTPEGVKKSKRRGHHHKHSLSHNFFSFLDPTQTNPALSSHSPSPGPTPAPKPEATPAPVPMPRLAPSSHNIGEATLSPLPPPKTDHHGQFLLSFAVLEFLIGAGLWIEGQMSGWRCLAGIGYLVVFDAIGVYVEMVARGEGQGWSSVRKPFGPSRYVSLLYFAQSLFLLFAAVYIAKESLEQVILGAGAHDHAVGGHGHGNSAVEGDERDFPHFLLFCAAAASIFSGGVLGNHGKLVDAVGSLFLTPSYLSLPFVASLPNLLANPFTLTIAGASAGILVSTVVVPPSALHSLDSFISLVLTIMVSALAYPPTLAFGHVLLQTAPPASQGQMVALRRALKEIKEDRRVVGLGTMRCWTITAGKGSYEDRYPSTPMGSRSNSVSGSPRMDRNSFSHPTPLGSPTMGRQSSFSEMMGGVSSYPSAYGSSSMSASNSASGNGYSGGSGRKDEGAPLVVTLVVHVHPDLGDREVLEVTRMSYGKLEGAVSGVGVPGLVKGRRDGEVSVQVKRGWEGLEDD